MSTKTDSHEFIGWYEGFHERDAEINALRLENERLRRTLMTPAQYKATIKALGLSQERAGVWLGIAPRTSQGYALGEYPVPEPVAKLLRLMIRLKLTPGEVG